VYEYPYVEDRIHTAVTRGASRGSGLPFSHEIKPRRLIVGADMASGSDSPERYEAAARGEVGVTGTGVAMEKECRG